MDQTGDTEVKNVNQSESVNADQLIFEEEIEEDDEMNDFREEGSQKSDKKEDLIKVDDDEISDEEIQDDDVLIEEQDEIIEDDDEIERKKQEAKNEIRVEKMKLFNYQTILFNNSKNKNSIIYLPTGSGKTMVSIISMYYYLCREGEGKKIIFLANTIQLVKQQAQSIRKNLQRIIKDQSLARQLRGGQRSAIVTWDAEQIRNKVCCIHGEKNDDIGMSKRKKIESQLCSKKEILERFRKSTIIVMIAQMFLNSLRRGYINLTDFSFIVFDECHHCSGDHPYMSIMKQFYFDKKSEIKKKEKESNEKKQKLPILMGLTASPLSQPNVDKDKVFKQIQQLSVNLDSTYSPYEKQDRLRNETQIQIVKVIQDESKQLYPDLISHFQKYRDHKQAYDRIKFHFKKYFECVKNIIDYLSSQYAELKLQNNDIKSIKDEIFIFYDIKECLLEKLRDLWLQLGQYAFHLGFNELILELQKITLRNQKNQLILKQTVERLKVYAKEYYELYGKCERQNFSGKVNKLIDILHDKQNIERSCLTKEKRLDMVLIFSAKRRTVKYLQEILNKYKQTVEDEEESKKFDCKSVTGYSSKSTANKSRSQHMFWSDPSSLKYRGKIEKDFDHYREELREQTKQQMIKGEGQSDNLRSQYKRMFFSSKYGKQLLAVEEKYTNQIKKINEFRKKQYRILITTSVTEEGFDIPECNTVISFDTPNSLKSYIQIKGRARKLNSKYFIFTSTKNFDKMVTHKQIFDDSIRATYQIAISKLAKEGIDPRLKYEADKGYKKRTIAKSGAIINTNFAREILKTYFSSLKQPNKEKYYYLETPNVCFKCIIYFPDTALLPQNYIVGEPEKTKDMAEKSAAYKAVIQLYKNGFIKTDLRPKKYEHLQEERELQKYNDIHETRKNEVYRMIFENNVKVRIDNEERTDRKFTRFYFKSILSQELDFPSINPNFKKHLPLFAEKVFKFQLYRINFSNTQQIPEMKKAGKEVGILTCFNEEFVNEIFNEYFYNFEENQRESFSLELISSELKLRKDQYQKLKQVHLFLLAGAQNREHHHYSQKAESDPIKSGWIDIIKKHSNEYSYDKERKYFPLLVLLQKEKQNEAYSIDERTNRRILQHEKIFTEIYRYHNYPFKQGFIEKFNTDLTEKMNDFFQELKSSKSYDNILMQSFERDFCFHKCLIMRRQMYTEEIQKDQKAQKHSVMGRHRKLSKMFHHTKEENIRDVVKINLWRKYKKDLKGKYFKRGEAVIVYKEEEPKKFFCLQEFLPYPIAASTLFKVSLGVEFVFKAYVEYSKAFRFRNIELTRIFTDKVKQVKVIPAFKYEIHKNIILQHQDKIFEYLEKNGGSKYLKNLGQIYREGSRFIIPDFSLSYDEQDLQNMSMSAIMNNSKVDKSINDSLHDMSMVKDMNNLSSLNESGFDIEHKGFSKKEEKQEVQLKENSLGEEQIGWKNIKIKEILRVLTSKMYKFNRHQNYEEYEFIGDVVLKMLSTIQIFLDKPDADESQLHIGRANIICNANLHRKAIVQQFFKYIMTKKYDEPPPPFRTSAYDDYEKVDYYHDTKIQLFHQTSLSKGFNYIPGKVHADVVEALIGVMYLKNKNLNECQALLYCLDILKKPNLNVKILPFQIDQENQFPKLFEDFEKRIGYSFTNKGLLIQALTHSSFKSILHKQIDKHSISRILSEIDSSHLSMISFMKENDNQKFTSKINGAQTFYERLEFLGDSILDLIVVQYLYQFHKGQDEGTLTLLKQAGVSNKTLGMIALQIGMHEIILMQHPENDKVMQDFKKIVDNFDFYLNKPEEIIKQKISSIKILGDVFEALVGAIFIDNQMNYQKTKEIMMKLIQKFLKHFTDLENIRNSNSYKFMKYLQTNNFKDCQVKKDTKEPIQEGEFNFKLVDRMGNVVAECFSINEKKAWDTLIERYADQQNILNDI